MEIILGKRNWQLQFDAEDEERVMQFNWHVCVRDDNVYACRREVNPDTGKKSKIYLHRWLLGVTDPKIYVDHENGDGLDCRRKNLRITDARNNSYNRVKTSSDTTTNYKGVTAVNGKFIARVGNKHIGTYDTASDAARAYDKAAIESFGEFAKPNFLASWGRS